MAIKKYKFNSLTHYDDDNRGEINTKESLTDDSDFVPTINLIERFLTGDLTSRHKLYFDDDKFADDLDTPPDLTDQRGVDIVDIDNLSQSLNNKQEEVKQEIINNKKEESKEESKEPLTGVGGSETKADTME